MCHKTVLRWSCLALVAVALAAGVLGNRATATPNPPEQDVQTLKRRLAEEIELNSNLRKGNEALRRRLSELGDQLTKLETQLKDQPAKIVVPPLLPAPADAAQPSMPKGSREQRFNNVPYYLIPLSAEPAHHPATHRL